MRRWREPLEDRYIVDPDTGCWNWQRAKNPLGYGCCWDTVRQIWTKAHRVVYERHVGPIPEGLEIDHLCRNPSCVNPEHLEPVTHRENTRRGRQGAYLRERTHCIHGHEFTPENTYIRAEGGRHCVACTKASSARSRARRKAL